LKYVGFIKLGRQLVLENWLAVKPKMYS